MTIIWLARPPILLLDLADRKVAVSLSGLTFHSLPDPISPRFPQTLIKSLCLGIAEPNNLPRHQEKIPL